MAMTVRGAMPRIFRVAIAATLIAGLVPATALASWRSADPVTEGKPVAEKTAHAPLTIAALPDDDIPGAPLPASPVLGSLNISTDIDDVYAVALQANDLFLVELTAAEKTSFELYLFSPDATTVDPGVPGYDEATLIDYSAWGMYPEQLWFRAPATATYYLDVYDAGDSGDYTLTYDIVPGEANDDISTCETISASPQTGSFAPGDYYDTDDVYKLALAEGQQVTFTLTGPVDADYDLMFFTPNATQIWGDIPPRVFSWGLTSSETITFLVPPGGAGTYYISVSNAGDPLGAYSLAYQTSVPLAPRISGATRYWTSYAVSRSSFTTSTAVVLATGADYPDALAASGLAGALDCPVLLVQPGRSLYDTEGLYFELWGLEASEIYIVGGEAAVSSDFEEELLMDGYDVTRIAGADRYQTAAAVADTIEDINGTASDSAFVACGGGYADALAVAPYAFSQGIPILLTRTGSLSSATEQYLDANDPTVYIVGGQAAVSSAVADAIRDDLGLTVHRMAGVDRYATAAEVAEYAIDTKGWGDWASMGIATGTNFPDALSGGAACGVRSGGLLLTRPTALSAAAADRLQTHSAELDQVLIFGGTGAVSDAVKTSVEGYLD